jgi:hypothetical protein
MRWVCCTAPSPSLFAMPFSLPLPTSHLPHGAATRGLHLQQNTSRLIGLFALCIAPAVQASALLHCEMTYAGSTQVLEARPVLNPYPVRSVDVGGRFWFKAVMVGNATSVDYIKLYAYLDTRAQPVLVQQATYQPPFAKGSSLTGKQFVYAGPVERELQYECSLLEAAP